MLLRHRLLVLSVLGCSSQSPPQLISTAKPYVLIAGQSNAAGIGKEPPVATVGTDYYLRVRGYTSPGWEPLRVAPGGRHGIEFALAAGAPRYRIVKTAWDSSYCEEWLDGQKLGELWRETRRTLALEQPDVLVWIQGESEANTCMQHETYGVCLASLLSGIDAKRTIVVELLAGEPLPCAEQVRAAQSVSGAELVSTDDIAVTGIHYDSTGLNLLGARIADLLLP